MAGRALLTEGDWKHNYELIFGIEYQLAECELLTASTAAAEQRLSMLAGRAESGAGYRCSCAPAPYPLHDLGPHGPWC